MCVYNDSLDWVIDFTPYFTLRYNENHGRYQIVRDCVYLLSKHAQILFWTGPTGCNLVKLEGPKIDFDRPWASGPPVLGALYTIVEHMTGVNFVNE